MSFNKFYGSIFPFYKFCNLSNIRKLGWSIEEPSIYEPSDYDINFVVQTDPRITLRIDFNQKVYEDRFISGILHTYDKLIDSFLQSPSIMVEELLMEKDERHLERHYWEGLLRDCKGATELEAIGPVGGSGTEHYVLAKSSFEELERIAVGSDERLHVLLYSVLITLLAKYTRETDILLGCPIYQQSGSSKEYINQMLCLRTVIQDDDSFRSLAGRCGNNLQKALQHQNYPFELIARYLNFSGKENWDTKGFFPIIMSIEGLHSEESYQDLDSELVFRFSTREQALTLNLIYNPERFGSEFMLDLARRFDTLLMEMLTHSSKPLRDIGLLPEKENKIHWGQPLAAPYPRIDQWISSIAKQKGDRCAISMGQNYISYAQLEAKSLQLAGYFKECGIEQGDYVGVMVDRSPEAIIAIIAVIRAAGVFVPIDSQTPLHRVQLIIAQSNLKYLIVDHPKSELDDMQQFTLEQLMKEADRPHVDITPQETPDALCYCLFTSGTTGVPKGCKIKHKSFANYINWAVNTYMSKVDSPISGWFTPLSFDFTLTSIFATLASGGQVIVFGQQQPIEQILSEVVSIENPINIVKLTPSHISVLGLLELTQTNLEVVVCGGEQLEGKHIDIINKITSQKAIIYNEYGPTEATVGCIVAEVSKPADKIPIGTPIYNTGFSIVDRNDKPLPQGIPGEILLTGENLMEGYLNNLDSEKLIELPWNQKKLFYRTGDLGYMHQGLCYFIGRVDQEFKLRGYRIHPNEILQVLEQYKGIKQAYIAKENDQAGDLLIGYVLTHHDIDIDLVRNYLNKHLPHYMIPSHFFVLDKFPIKPSGKMDVGALPSYQSWKGSGSHYAPPRSSIEKQLVAIWENVLAKEQIGIFDNFFLIGGHSLHATQVITRIKKNITQNIDFRAIYNYPDISQLAKHISSLPKSDNQKDTVLLKPIGVQKDYPLSHAQHRIWIIDQLDRIKQGYITSGMYRIDGDLDVHAFIKSFEQLIDRHQILRSRIVQVEGQARQQVLTREEIGFKVVYQDHAGDPEQAFIEMEQKLHQPFDLQLGPLIRIMLFKAVQGSYCLSIALHHIICDGWSMNIILKEIKECYSALKVQREPQLQKLKIQYKDYAAWEKKVLEKNQHQLSSFWKKHLDGPNTPLELPLDYPRPQTKSYKGGVVELVLEQNELQKLYDITRKKNLSLFAILMSCIKVLLFHITKSKNIIVGTAVSNRDQLELENQIGLYVNTLPFKTSIDPQLTLIDFITSEHHRIQNILQHQNYPFDKIVDDLNHTVPLNRNPLFDAGFTWHTLNIDVEGFNKDLNLTTRETYLESAKTDLWFHGILQDSSLRLLIEFDKSIFQEKSILLMIRKWEHLLGNLGSLKTKKLIDTEQEYPKNQSKTSKMVFDFKL